MIRVIVQDENGNALGDGIDISSALIPSLADDRFVCLRFIDPYGDTLFNRLQLPGLLQDLSLLKASLNDHSQLSEIKTVEELVDQCKKEPHLYLKMIGD